MFVVNDDMCQVMYHAMMCRWGDGKDRTIKEKGLFTLISSTILSGDAILTWNYRIVMFACLQSNIISVLFKFFWLGWQETALAGGERAGIEEITPSKFKNPWF